MVRKYIDSVRETFRNANKAVENCIKDLLVSYGDNGLELNEKTDNLFSVIYEEFPNEFEKIEYIRVYGDFLQVKTDCNKDWRKLYPNNTDLAFLLDEVESAISALEE